MDQKSSGTLAIDLGNTNTVIAFQGVRENNSILIEIPSITSSPGVIPTAIWFEDESKNILIGSEALMMKNQRDKKTYT